MSDVRSSSHVRIARLIFLPALLSLAVTILRLIGLIFIWLAMAIPAAIQLLGWPELFKTLLAYGLASRIPVVIVMFFAMRGNWGTHYDFVGMPEQFQMPLWPRFFWLAFFPQLVFWVAFTILMGSLTGSIAFALLGKRRVADEVQVF